MIHGVGSHWQALSRRRSVSADHGTLQGSSIGACFFSAGFSEPCARPDEKSTCISEGLSPVGFQHTVKKENNTVRIAKKSGTCIQMEGDVT